MPITEFTKHDERGFDVLESVPLAEYSERFLLPLKIVRVSWRDSNRQAHQMDAQNLLIQVLPDRTGLMCLEMPKAVNGYYVGHSGAFVINEDAALRYRLHVPIELTNLEEIESPAHYFSWVAQSEEYSRYGLVAVVAGAGTYHFELDYHTGQFLWGKGIRD